MAKSPTAAGTTSTASPSSSASTPGSSSNSTGSSKASLEAVALAKAAAKATPHQLLQLLQAAVKVQLQLPPHLLTELVEAFQVSLWHIVHHRLQVTVDWHSTQHEPLS